MVPDEGVHWTATYYTLYDVREDGDAAIGDFVSFEVRGIGFDHDAILC